MPPRSSTRKKSTPASTKEKKSTTKSRQLGVGSSPVDENVVALEIKDGEFGATEDTGNQEEVVSAEAADGEGEQAAVEQIKHEFRASDTSSTVEPYVKEEVCQEEGDVEDVMGDGMNVKIEDFVDGSGGDGEDGGEGMESVHSDGGNEKNDSAYAPEVTDKSDDAAEENGTVDGHNERRDDDNGGTQLADVPVAEKNLCDEGTSAIQIGDAEALCDNDNVLVVDEGGNGKGDEEECGMDDTEDNEEADKVDKEDEENPSIFIDNHITQRTKEQDLEIFIGNLGKGDVEDDLIKVFGKFGEIRSVRLVRNPTTNQSRGFAFIQYATVEQAKNALSALKDGIQIGGKRVKMAASQDNDTLYMGNICKLWTKERVLETLKSYGIGNIKGIHVPNDSKKEGKIRGFAFLEFSTHSDALAAFQRLRKPDAVFGRDKCAKVAFAQTPMHPNEEVLSQVKASIAKPHVKGRLQKHGTRGGFKVTEAKEVPSTKEESERENKAVSPTMEGHAKSVKAKKKAKSKSEKAEKKARMVAEEKGKALFEPEIGGGGELNKHPSVTEDQRVHPSTQLGKKNHKNENLHSKVEGRGKTGAKLGRNEMQSKKQMGTGNKRGRQNNNSRKPKRDAHVGKGSNYGADSIKYRNPRRPGYDTSSASYQSRVYTTTMSGSKRPYADMEPHAGYLQPVARKQSRRSSGYVEPRVGIPPVRVQYQPLVGCQESAVVTQSLPQTAYHEPSVVQYSRPHPGYLAPAAGTYGQPHTGYLEPAVARHTRSHAVYAESAVPKYSHDPYMRRVGQQVLHASDHSAYGSGSSLPSSYVPSYTNYVGYEGGSSVSGGGAHLLRRAYY